jgi:hypothetical protein
MEVLAKFDLRATTSATLSQIKLDFTKANTENSKDDVW